MVVRRAYILLLFDINGLRWQVDTTARCCCSLDAVGEEIRITEDHGIFTTWVFDFAAGHLLEEKKW